MVYSQSKKLYLTNAGAGYTVAPSIRILGGGGSGAIATCNVITSGQGVISVYSTQEGRGYTTNPAVTVAGPRCWNNCNSYLL